MLINMETKISVNKQEQFQYTLTVTINRWKLDALILVRFASMTLYEVIYSNQREEVSTIKTATTILTEQQHINKENKTCRWLTSL